MKTKIVFGGLIFLLLAFVAWFGAGGGFAGVEVINKKEYSLQLYGKHYEGSLQSKKAFALFDEVEKVLNGKPMYVFYDGIPSKENNYSVKMVVGSANSFVGAEVVNIKFDEVLSARHDSYYVLNKAQTKIMNYAKENNKTLNMQKMIEIYHSKNDLERIIPVVVE